MGHSEHRQNPEQRHRWFRVEGKTLRRNLAALVGCALAASAVFAYSHQDGDQDADKPTLVQITKPADLKFDQDEAWKFLVQQCDFGPRVPGTPAHDKCRDYLLKEMAKYTDDARLQPFSFHWRYNDTDLHMDNIIGDQDWKDAKVHVMIMAHWDSRPFADQSENVADHTKPILGADDGASGVAVMLELAKALKGHHPGVGIEFLLDDGEDLGPGIDQMLLGVDYYAKHLPTPKPDYSLLLDMIGNKGVQVPIEVNSYDANPQLCRDFYNAATQDGFGKTFPNRFGEQIEDDHLPMISAGIPSIDLIDFNYPYWHTLQDTPDKCSPESLGNIGKGLESWFLRKPIYIPKTQAASDRN